MPTLIIRNPATGDVIDERGADDAASVAAKAAAARAAQPAWAAMPLRERLAAVEHRLTMTTNTLEGATR